MGLDLQMKVSCSQAKLQWRYCVFDPNHYELYWSIIYM
jgi:hypothetical protein